MANQAKSKGSRWFRYVCVIAIGMIISSAALVACNGYFDAPEKQTITETPKVKQIHALGRLEPMGRIRKLSAPAANEGAAVARLLVKEGDDVSADQLLAVLDNYDRRLAALKEAEAKVQTASSRLAQIQAGARKADIDAQKASVKLLNAKVRYNQNQLARYQQLYLKNAISIEELEDKQWTVLQTKLELERAEQQLISIAEVRDVDVEVAKQEVLSAQAAVVKARADLEVTQIKSPVNGRILKIHAMPGEKISEAGLLELGDVERMQAVAEVFEDDLFYVKVGCSATVKLDSNGEAFTGTVTELGNLVARKDVLSNDPVSDTDARVVEVRIDLGSEASRRLARLSNARVEVMIQRCGE